LEEFHAPQEGSKGSEKRPNRIDGVGCSSAATVTC
jgi:hypothetical protein